MISVKISLLLMLSSPLLKMYKVLLATTNLHVEFLLILKKHLIQLIITLLSKLNYYRIRGIANDWFKSYLSNRSQFVSINGFNTNHQPIECGVPQGPLLFLIFINDLNFGSQPFILQMILVF